MEHTTNFRSAFIEVADDSPVTAATEPPLNPQKKSSARTVYELLREQPYVYTSDDLLFSLYAQKQATSEEDKHALRITFFSKGQPCMRTSDLPKKYGWGIHFDEAAKMALIPLGSAEYEALRNDPNLKHEKAMRSARA